MIEPSGIGLTGPETVSQLVEAARLGAEALATLCPYPEGFDPADMAQYDAGKRRAYDEAEQARKEVVSVQEKDGYSREFDDLEQLAQIPEQSLESVRSIAITLGGSSYVPPAVTIRATGSVWLGLGGRLSVEIAGRDRTWTAGLRHRLEALLEPRWRLHAPFLNRPAVTIIFPGVLVLIVFFGVAYTLKWLNVEPRSTRLIVANVAMGLSVMISIALVWASSRRVEFLPEGGLPLYQRWRARLLAWTGAVVIGVIDVGNLGRGRERLDLYRGSATLCEEGAEAVRESSTGSPTLGSVDLNVPLPKLLRLRGMVARAVPLDDAKVTNTDAQGLTDGYNRLRIGVQDFTAGLKSRCLRNSSRRSAARSGWAAAPR